MVYKDCEYAGYQVMGTAEPLPFGTLTLSVADISEGDKSETVRIGTLTRNREQIASFRAMNDETLRVVAQRCDSEDVALVLFDFNREMIGGLELAPGSTFLIGCQFGERETENAALIIFKGGFGWVKVSENPKTTYYICSTGKEVVKILAQTRRAVEVCDRCLTRKDQQPHNLYASANRLVGILMLKPPVVVSLDEGAFDKLDSMALAVVLEEPESLEQLSGRPEYEILGSNAIGGSATVVIVRELLKNTDADTASGDECVLR